MAIATSSQVAIATFFRGARRTGSGRIPVIHREVAEMRAARRSAEAETKRRERAREDVRKAQLELTVAEVRLRERTDGAGLLWAGGIIAAFGVVLIFSAERMDVGPALVAIGAMVTFAGWEQREKRGAALYQATSARERLKEKERVLAQLDEAQGWRPD